VCEVRQYTSDTAKGTCHFSVICHFKASIFNAAAKVIGYRKTCPKDWFDEQDSEARSLLDDMLEKHLIWMND